MTVRQLNKTDKYLLAQFTILRSCLDALERHIREHGSAYAAVMGGLPVGVLTISAQIWVKLSSLDPIRVRRR